MRTQNENRRAPRFLLIGGIVATFGLFAVIAAPDPSESVEKDLDKIALHENEIALQKEQWKQSNAKNDELGKSAACRDMKKAKADLKRDKAHLRADRKFLIEASEANMSTTAVSMRSSKRDLCDAKHQLKKDLRQGNSAALVNDAELVAKHQRNFDRHEAKLDNQQAALNGQLAAIDEKLEQPNLNNSQAQKDEQGKFARNATASTDNTTYYYSEETTKPNTGSAVLEK